jgi:hypothetical protein
MRHLSSDAIIDMLLNRPPLSMSVMILPADGIIPEDLTFVDELRSWEGPEADEAPPPSMRAIVTAFPPDDGRFKPSWFFRAATQLGAAAEGLPPGSYGLVFAGWRTLTATVDAIQVAGFEHRGIIAWGASHGRRSRFVVVGRRPGNVGEIAWPGYIAAEDESAVVHELLRRMPPTPELIDPFGTILR